MLSTSGFMDDVTFGRMVTSFDEIPGRSLMSMNALFVLFRLYAALCVIHKRAD